MFIEKVQGTVISKGKVGRSTAAKLGAQGTREGHGNVLKIGGVNLVIIGRAQHALLDSRDGGHRVIIGRAQHALRDSIVVLAGGNFNVQHENRPNKASTRREGVIIRRTQHALLDGGGRLVGVIIGRAQHALGEAMVVLGGLHSTLDLETLKLGVSGSLGKGLVEGLKSGGLYNGKVIDAELMEKSSDREETKSSFTLLVAVDQRERSNFVARVLQEGERAMVGLGQVGRSTGSKKVAEGLNKELVVARVFKGNGIIVRRAQHALLGADLDISHKNLLFT